MRALNCLVVLLIIILKSTDSALIRHTFVIEYFSGSPDGALKEILGINGQFPGPVIEAQIGDTLQVDVVNRIQDRQNVSIHWHGIHQKDTQWNDGPPYITQCPLAYLQTQRYSFQLKQGGTFWYHSHVRSQYTDGLWGVLIVHKPEPYSYDRHIVIALSDWYHHTAEENEHFQLLPYRGAYPYPNSGLINGVGRCNCAFAINPCNVSQQMRPLFKVQPEKTYRIHVINTAALFAFNFSIDGHTLQVIEADSIDVKDGLFYDAASLASGQRYSFLIRTNQTSATRFHIRAQLRSDLAFHGEVHIKSNNNEYPKETIGDVSAILEYSEEDTVEFEPFSYLDQVPLLEVELNHLDEMKLGPLNGAYAPPTADLEVILSVEFYYSSDNIRRGTFNSTPFIIEDGSKPLLMSLVDGETINDDLLYFEVEHMKVVTVIVNNLFIGPHPFHLHGHDFWVLGIGRKGDGTFQPMRDTKTLVLTGPKRDTVMVEQESWVVIRFIADNPGVWLFHCHIDWHMLVGMSTVFVVGRNKIEKMKVSDEALHVCKYNMYNVNANDSRSDDKTETTKLPSSNPNSSVDYVNLSVHILLLCICISYVNI